MPFDYQIPPTLVLPRHYFGRFVGSVVLPEGWQTLSVNQLPRYGTDYPFVNPSPDVSLLLGDLFLTYEDDACDFVPPFHVAWLYGFGSGASIVVDGFPSPTHDMDILIRDANGIDVFNSTTVDEYAASAWGTQLETLLWTGETAALRLTRHTGLPVWAAGKTFQERIHPTRGELDARTYRRMPRRVRSISVSGLELSGNIDLTEGFNINLSTPTQTQTDGGRLLAGVRIRGNPGDGLGRRPGCDDVEPTLKRINGVEPSDDGDLSLDLSSCYWLNRPAVVASESPRVLDMVSPNLLTEGEAYGIDLSQMVDFTLADNAEELRALMENPSSTLRLLNDCDPCCACDDYIATYQALKNMYDKFLAMGATAEQVRDTHKTNVQRWNAQLACRLAKPLRLRAVPSLRCRVSIGGAYCNLTTCCITPLVLRTTIEHLEGGVDLGTNPHIVCNSTKRSGTDTGNQEEEYTLRGSFSVFDTYFDYADPQSVSTFRTLMQFQNCSTNQAVRITLSAHAPDPISQFGETCELPDPLDVGLPLDIVNVWQNSAHPPYPLRAFVQQTVALRPDERCEC